MKTHFDKLSVKHFVRLSADRLNSKTEKLSPIKKKIALFIFCLCFSGTSAYIIWNALVSKSISPNTVFVKRTPVPAHIGRTNDLKSPSYVSPADFNRVELIKKYLDSLSLNDRKVYSEIMQLRPHLMDSIHLLETFYLQNLKK